MGETTETPIAERTHEETVKVIAEQLARKNVTPETIAGYDMLQTAVMSLMWAADRSAAKNYIEITMGGLQAPFDRAAIHLIRPGGKTPSELQREAESELGGARVELRLANAAIEDRELALWQARDKAKHLHDLSPADLSLIDHALGVLTSDRNSVDHEAIAELRGRVGR
jgi:hypothetical protein